MCHGRLFCYPLCTVLDVLEPVARKMRHAARRRLGLKLRRDCSQKVGFLMDHEVVLNFAYHQWAKLDGVGFAVRVFPMWDGECAEGVMSPVLGSKAKRRPQRSCSMYTSMYITGKLRTECSAQRKEMFWQSRK